MTDYAREAIGKFVRTGEWPLPGTLPVCARLPRIAVVHEPPECQGHPAGPYDQMGETTYCDGSCKSAN